MKTLALIGVVVALVVPATAGAASWHRIARASDSSEFYTSAMVSTKVRNARRVFVAWGSSESNAQIEGSVLCTSINGYGFESRDFSFFVSKKGARNLPMPLRRADCTYIVSMSLDGGGAVAFELDAYR